MSARSNSFPLSAALAVVLLVALPAGLGAAKRDAGLDGIVITIDPGHNGRNYTAPGKINRQVSIGKGETKECDTTGTASASGYSESRLNWRVAVHLRRWLRERGAEVVMTRNDDKGVGPCINRRARIGNRARSDAAVSIHADGAGAGAHGFHVIRPARIGGLTKDIFRPSRRLARSLRDRLDAAGLDRSTYAGRRGIDERSDLGGLRLSDVPKVFVEMGNMRNPADARLFERRSGRERLAEAIGKGLRKFALAERRP